VPADGGAPTPAPAARQSLWQPASSQRNPQAKPNRVPAQAEAVKLGQSGSRRRLRSTPKPVDHCRSLPRRWPHHRRRRNRVSSKSCSPVRPFLAAAACPRCWPLTGLPNAVRRRLAKRRSMRQQHIAPPAMSLVAKSVFRNTGGQSVDTSHSMGRPISARPGPGSIDTDEVDPVAEADVYMAYGRDAQAEEILLEAKQKDPGATPFTLKLLEIYWHAQGCQALWLAGGRNSSMRHRRRRRRNGRKLPRWAGSWIPESALRQLCRAGRKHAAACA
jgi:hypothetical protein